MNSQTHASQTAQSEHSPEILLLQEMSDASFRQMDQDRMLSCCTAGLSQLLGGQGVAVLIEEMEESWYLTIHLACNISTEDLQALQNTCEITYNEFSKVPVMHEACRRDVRKLKNPHDVVALKTWTAFPLWVEKQLQGLLLLDLAGAPELPSRLEIVLHQLCTGLLSLRNMRQLLITDPMTSCYNRWFMEIELSKFCENTSAQKDAFAVMVLDVDHFKQINDRYGHSSGDHVLVHLADLLRTHTDPGDAAIRMGGDEFLIWFPRVRNRDLQAFGNDLLNEIANQIKIPDAPEHKISLSIGLVQKDPDGRSISKEQLLDWADHALYTAKCEGRGQLVHWSPELENQPGLWSDPEEGIHKEVHILQTKVIRLEKKIAKDQNRLVDLLTNILGIKEFETGLHSHRVALITDFLLKHLPLSDEEKTAIHHGAKLHDIGKIAIPEAILHKTTSLTESEWTIIRQHPQLGHRIIENHGFHQATADIILYHHECFDGSGYPKGLKGNEIPLGARLFCLLDAYDSMRANRIYKPFMPRDQVIAELQSKSGSQFDPELLEFFLEHVEEIEKIGQWQS